MLSSVWAGRQLTNLTKCNALSGSRNVETTKPRGVRTYYSPGARSKPVKSHWHTSRQLSEVQVNNRSNVTQEWLQSMDTTPPRRHAEMTSLLLLTKMAAASSILYLAGRWLLHHPRQQRRAVTRSFADNTQIHLDTSVPQLLRKSEAAFLKRWFDSPPNGPIVLAGPLGAGRSYLIKKVLSERKMTIYVDFRREPVVSGEEFVGGIVEAAGYVIPQATEIMRMFTRESQRNYKITSQEADRALSIILEALQVCKAKKWVDGIPLICLDDMNVSGMKGASGNQELDPFWTKFLDWCVYITDAKLAHVVFVPSQSYEPHNILYEHATFRSKRILLFVDYPSAEKVFKYVHSFVTEFCPNSFTSEERLNHMVGWITNCLGGQLDDLMHILGALKRGDKYGSVLRRMITDAVSTLEERLEQVLSEAHQSVHPKEDVYKKYLRLWAAMEMLRDHEFVNRRDIVRHVFKEHTVELKQYVEWGIFAYANQKAEIDDGAASTTATTTTDGDASGTPVAPQTKASYPIWWKSDAPASDTKPDELTAQQARQLTEKTEADASQPTSTPPQESTPAAPAPPKARRTHSSLLNASLESMLVSAGSPRLRIAFDLLLKDERLADRKEAMTIHLSAKSIQDKLDKLEVSRKQQLEELQVVLGETNRLLTLLSTWRQEFGEEFVEARKTRLMNQETEIHRRLDALHQETLRLQEQKNELEARSKQLSVRL